MANYKIPSILWGTSFANTLTFGYIADSCVAYSKPRQGSDWMQAQSGEEGAWITGTDYYLEVDLRWIPTSDTASPLATGWEGSTGVRAFLEWSRAKNQFRFCADKNVPSTYITSYLVEPIDTPPELEPDGTRKIRLIMRNTSSEYTGY